jgi:AraC-like DNA-binding protein
MTSENYWYIVAVINLLGIAQGVFLSVVLLTLKGGNLLANRLLAALLLCFAIGIAGATLGASGYYIRFPHLIRVGDPVVLLSGPFFYLYARALTGTLPALKDVLHFLPFVTYLLMLIPFYSQTGEEKIQFVRQMQESRTKGVLFMVLLRSVFLLIYTYASYRLLKRYNHLIRAAFSNIDKLNLEWLNQVARLLFVVILCSLLMYVLVITRQLSFLVSNYISALLLTLIIYLMGILGIRQARLFVATDTKTANVLIPEKNQAEQPVKATVKYEKSTLSPGKSRKYLQKLLESMQQDKLYLKADLSLQLLADTLEIPPHYLSQVINEQLGQNFFDFVNSYRIEEVKARLLDPQNHHLTILAIAYDSGFNSKSAFNLAFKNQTGFTPSQFRARHKG